MKPIRVTRPFTLGKITDVPDWAVPARGAVTLQDAVNREGVVTMRAGWTLFDSTSIDIQHGVAFNRYVLAEATRTVETGGGATSFEMFDVAGGQLVSGIGAPYDSGNVEYQPRAVYRDEVLFCHVGGRYALIRYSGGGALPASSGPGTCTTTTNRSTMTATAGTWGASLTSGNYVRTSADLGPPSLWLRITKRVSSTVVNLEGVRAGLGRAGLTKQSNANFGTGCIGYTYPCIPIYAGGTLSTTAAVPSVVTGVGTSWNTGETTLFGGVVSDAILRFEDGQPAKIREVVTVTSDTGLTFASDAVSTDVPYQALRRCPFRDVAVQHDCLFGSGVYLRPSTVFILPPGWNPSLPPGAVEPFDFMDNTAATAQNTNPGFFRAVEVDVPGPYDGDRVCGLLAAEGIVLVVKEQNVYGIFGSLFPEFAVQRIPTGDGRGAFFGGGPQSIAQLPSGAFWAGRQGVFTYAGGQVVDLTEGKISREWRDFMSGANADAVVTEADKHLIVCAFPQGMSNGGQGTYQLDLRTGAWSTITNLKLRSAWAYGPGGASYAVLQDGFGTADLAAMYKEADGTTVLAIDGQGSGPALLAQTGSGIHLDEDSVDQELRLVDVAVTGNFLKSGIGGPTAVVSHVHGGGLGGGTSDDTKTVVTITLDGIDRVDRFREYSRRTGRRHAIKVQHTRDTSTQYVRKMEVHELALNFRSNRRRP